MLNMIIQTEESLVDNCTIRQVDVKVRSYIARYPVLGTVQSVYTSLLEDQFIPVPNSIFM